MKKVLTIAGSDSSGGAGIQGDIKTMSALGVYSMSVITAITAQNSLGVQESFTLPSKLIKSQLDALFSDIEIDGIKIGMLADEEIVRVVREKLTEYGGKNIVLDTVMLSKNGYPLLNPSGIEELKKLIAMSTVVTPNIPEAEVLAQMSIDTKEDIERACIKIEKLGATAVLLKGGHSKEDNCIDTLYYAGEFYYYSAPRLDKKNTHGTGCTLSSAIASFLAKGEAIPESIRLAKEYLTRAIEKSFDLGHGIGPLGHF